MNMLIITIKFLTQAGRTRPFDLDGIIMMILKVVLSSARKQKNEKISKNNYDCWPGVRPLFR